MTTYLVDNSVLQRLPRSSAVQDSVRALLDDEHELCCCAATMDEFAFSARSEAERQQSVARLTRGFRYLAMDPAIDDRIIEIRKALFTVGHGRAAGVIDVQIAATAAHYSAHILHYDSDFEHIASVYPDCPARWVVPRGAIS